jgi:hypothetical protein
MINKIKLSVTLSCVFICLLVIGIYIYSRKTLVASEKVISSLNSTYQNNLNQKPKFESRIISFDSKTTEGGEMTVYFDRNDGTTKIIEGSYAGETFFEKYDYYFADVDHFLVIENNKQWDRPFYSDGRIEIKNEVNKYYFSNIKMIRWVDSTSQIVNLQSEVFKRKENQILQQLEQFLSLINK